MAIPSNFPQRTPELEGGAEQTSLDALKKHVEAVACAVVLTKATRSLNEHTFTPLETDQHFHKFIGS